MASPPSATDYLACMVSGAPRGGTTLLQALVCSSPDANDVIPECTYMTSLLEAYEIGVNKFIENYYYFDSLEHYHAFNHDLIHGLIDYTWVKSGKPRILVLRDPRMTKFAPSLARLEPRMKFIISIRDPRDVVASRLTVFRKQSQPSHAEISDQARYACEQYLDYYTPLLKQAATFADRTLWLAYEDFAAGRGVAEIERFLDTKLALDKMWNKAELGFHPEWITNLYHSPPSTASVGSYESQLTPDLIRYVESQTGAVYDTLKALAKSQPAPA